MKLILKKKAYRTKEKRQGSRQENVWPATDEDREGEAIAWHLCKVLISQLKQPMNRSRDHQRCHVHAIKNPRTVYEFGSGATSRQILNRLVALSSAQSSGKKSGESRLVAFSPATRILVEREREIMKLEAIPNPVTAIFIHYNQEFIRTNQKLTRKKRQTSSNSPACRILLLAIFKTGTRNPAAPPRQPCSRRPTLSLASVPANHGLGAKIVIRRKKSPICVPTQNGAAKPSRRATDFIKRLYGPQDTNCSRKTKIRPPKKPYLAIHSTDITQKPRLIIATSEITT